MWQKLIKVMDLQQNKYDQILERLKEQQYYIIKNKVDELDNINAVLTDMYNEANNLEQARLTLMRNLVASGVLPQDNMSFQELKKYIPQNLLTDYQRITDKLQETVLETKRCVDNNQSLLKLSLQYVDLTVNALMGTSRSGYGGNGEEQDGGRKNSVLNFKG